MKKRRLGSSGISVNPIGLGAMPLSTVNRPTSQQAIHLICEALDAGIDFIDTADVYCLDDNDIGHNERLIAKALKAWQGSTPVTVATKGGLVRPNGDWVDNGHPDHLKAACEASLIALDTETIDLYHFHEPDKKVPFEESMGALIDLKNAGKIRNLGLSNATLEQIIQARKMVDIVSVQDRCSPFDLDYFRNGIIDYCEQQNIAFLAYSPVGGGNGKVRTENSHPLNKVAQAFNATPYQIALAWLLEKSPVMIPIPGASRVENAISSADAMSIKLSDDDMLYLNQAFGVEKT
jgi:aryl-alcohol dehydrogenase-like predicted oxidoreductase